VPLQAEPVKGIGLRHDAEQQPSLVVDARPHRGIEEGVGALDIVFGTQLADQLGGQATDVLDRTQRMLSDSVIANVQTGAEGFAGTMTELNTMLERQSATLEQLIQHLESATASLDQAADGPELERTVQNLDSLTMRLAAASEQFDSTSKSLDSILRKIDEGQGSMGKLVNDPILHERMVAAMENMQAASEEVALMMKSFREDPEKYTKGLNISLF